jgi:hypothetical protein
VGTACSPEGLSCGGPCSDPCQFCNIIRCEKGKWQRLEAHPDPSCRDAGTPTLDAYLSWQAPYGFAGRGPAIIVRGDGNVRVWDSVSPFEPAGAPSAAPSATHSLKAAQAAELFKLWASTDLASLPHPGGGAECDAVVYVKMCASCDAQTLRYQQAKTLSPEMENVWSWFEKNLPNARSAQTRYYCAF